MSRKARSKRKNRITKKRVVGRGDFHRTPPTRSSATQRARAEVTSANARRNARAWNRDLRVFIGWNRPDVEAMRKGKHSLRYVATRKVKKDLSD
jgi:hypothetical protein